MSLLRQLRNLNLKVIDQQAHKPVRLLVAGPEADAFIRAIDPQGEARPEVLARFDAASYAGASPPGATIYAAAAGAAVADSWLRHDLPVFIVELPSAGGEPQPRIVTSAPAAKPERGRPGRYALASLEAAELRKHLLPDVLGACEPSAVALAAAVPAFRFPAAVKLTQDAAMKSLKLAAASAVIDHVPIVGLVLGGIASAGDTVAITGLQINMLLHIAAAYGKKVEFARLIELLPVIGGGYGWRILARELSGFIPVAGIAVKAAIAYAGTLVVGQAAAYYYETGMAMTPQSRKAAYGDAVERAKVLFKGVADKIKR